MLSFTHELFGHNKPELTKHFFQRYSERVFNVPEKSSESWSKVNYNRIRIVRDFYDRLKKASLIKNENILNYYHEKYGKDVQFLKNNKYIFVIRDYKVIVTIFREE
jgi:hypothetical protein